LAEKHAYVCPIFNSSPAQLLTEARLGLARALGHMGELDEAVETYRRLLRDGPPKPSILGGLGRCLARQGKFEDAYTHLRAAYDQEKAHDPLTVGYLALCGARGRSRTPEDRLKNVSWALDLLDPIGLPGNTEWAELCSSVYAEARSLGLEISRTRQVRLCEILASATLVDPNAAGAYQQLHATHPDGVALPYAWLYCRAVQQYGVAADNDLELFALAFREPREACAYYAARQWDFEEIEIIYLERASVREPGRFPKALGADYPVRGEKLLLERARRQEANGNRAAALATVEVLLKLAPGCLEGIDRLAQLCYRQKNLRRAAELLGDLHRLTPGDPQPLVRQALIEHQLRNRGTWTLILESALKCAQSKDLANIALIGARLAIADLLSAFDSQAAVPAEAPEFQLAMQWLDRCQTFAPSQPETDWCRAALWSWAGVTENLAAQTAKLSDAELEDGRYQFARALSCMAAGRHSEAQAAAERAARLLPTLELECASVIGQACLKAGDKDGALVALQKVAKRNNGLLGDLARAHLGNLEFQSKNLNEAVTWWQSVTPAQRQAWNIDSALPVALLLAGLHDLNDGRFPDAANRFREAGRMGSRERGLGSLLILALVKDAHSHREADNGDRTTEARLLEQAINAGCRDPQLFYSLALARKRLGHFYEARAALSRIADPDALDLLQMGILSLAMNQVEQAEHDFTRAYEKNPDLSVVCHNLLLARLSLGQIQESLSLAERAMHGAATEHDPALWQVLHALLTACTVAEGSLGQEPAFASLDSITEDRLLELIRGLGHLEAMSKLLDALLRARPGRALLRQACQEISLLNAYGAMERCDWTHAEKLLETLASSELASLELSPTLSNMLGCCAMMAKDYHRAALHFDEALQSFPADPSLEQNIALAHEGRAAWPIANKHWDRFFTLLDRGVPSPPGHPDYVKKLHHAALSRLASNYVSLECWAEALTYAQRLANLHPDDKENQERLFHLYSQAGLTDEARRALRRLRQTWPGEPFLDLPETDLYDATALEGIDVGLDEVDRLLQRRLSDGRAEMRVFDLIGAVIPLLEKGLTQLWDQFTRVTAQLRHLPHYQVDWSTVHESTSDLRNELGRLRRLISKCSKLVQDDQQRAQLDELYKEVEQKLRQCRAVRA
jgi:tetratricopeptide (TPR) repeat protein